jgi:proteasome lid subunit RPN8/RPN11
METNEIQKNLDNKDNCFKIKKNIYKNMISYCQKAIPNEACGLLSGVQATGSTLWKIKNEALNPNRFFMSEESIKMAVKKMDEYGEKLSGIFHSHPSSRAFPSSLDIKNNSYTQLAYIIVSFYKGKVDVGCFKIDGKTVIPLRLIVIDK